MKFALTFQIVDDRLLVNATLYAYSTYNVGDMKASAVPAIAFTFVVKIIYLITKMSKQVINFI